MLRRRLPIGLIAPIALVILVVALGTLQYRWVGQVSERERDQLRQSLDRRARDFADDFDREIGRAYQVFAPESGFTPEAADRFARQYDEWQSSSPFAGLVKTAYFAEASGDDFTLHRYTSAARQFDVTAWPEALAPVHARLAASHSRTMTELAGPANVIALTATPVMIGVPAVVIPETHEDSLDQRRMAGPPAPGTAINMVVTVTSSRNYVVLELDRAFIAATMLPALADRHFPETGGDRFRMSVVAPKSDVVFTRGLPADQTIDPKAADAVTSFFGLRMEAFGFLSKTLGTALTAERPVTWSTIRREAPTTAGGQLRMTPVPLPGAVVVRAPTAPKQTNDFYFEQSATTAVRTSMSGWTLLLQHSAGSLDAAVAQARRRNLFMSFGILGVLAASAGLVMVNARRSEKLAAQQMEFVATVSHELRTPLAVIRSAAQNLSAGVVHDPGQAQRYGDLIEAEGRRLTDMVEQVLEYAGLSDAKRRPSVKPMDAAPVVRDVVAASSSLTEAAGVQFDVRIDDDVPPVLADEDAIRRALHNLIGNALKYAGEGRWVGVTAARGRGSDEGFVLVSVADHGRGIAADDAAHIFEPFYRGRHAVEDQIRGNGLGLSLVKQLVLAIGGRVSVASTPGEGSTFTLHVPVATGAAPEAA